MCNDYGNHIPYSDYLAAFSQTRIPVRWPTSAPNLEAREDIWPTDKPPVIRRLEDGTNEFTETPVGLFACSPQRSASHQFPLRRTTVPGWPLPRAGLVFLRVHGQEIAEDEMAVHQGR